MRRRSSTVFARIKPLNPTLTQSKITSTRWSIFCNDLKKESREFKEDFEKISAEHAQVDGEFESCARKSFYSVCRTEKPKPVHYDPAQKRNRKRRELIETNREKEDVYVGREEPISKDFPVRSSSAQRVLYPEKLKLIYEVQPRKKDIFVVSGFPLHDIDS